MRIDALVERIAQTNPVAIPQLLVRHFPDVIADYRTLLGRVGDGPARGGLRAAFVWLMALGVAEEAIVNGHPSRPTLSDFGVALLDRVVIDVLALSAHPARPPRLGPDEVMQLDAALWDHLRSGPEAPMHVLVLAQVAQAAIGIVPTMMEKPRQELGVTALVIADYLQALATGRYEAILTDTVAALRETGASCFPPRRVAEARQAARRLYEQLRGSATSPGSPTGVAGLAGRLLAADPEDVPGLLLTQLREFLFAPTPLIAELRPRVNTHPQASVALLCLRLILEDLDAPGLSPLGLQLLAALAPGEVAEHLPPLSDYQPRGRDFRQLQRICEQLVLADHFVVEEGLLLARILAAAEQVLPVDDEIVGALVGVSALALAVKFQELGDPHEALVVRLLLLGARLFPRELPQWRLCQFHLLRRRVAEGEAELDDLIAEVSDCADNLPEDLEEWGAAHQLASMLLARRFEMGRVRTDLDRMLHHFSRFVPAIPDERERAHGYFTWALMANMRRERTNLPEHLDETIALAHLAERNLKPSDPQWLDCQVLCAEVYGDRYDGAGDPEDLEANIQHWQRAVQASPPRSEQHGGYLMNLASWLGARFHARNKRADLDLALEHFATAAGILQSGSEPWAKCQLNWANALDTLYGVTGNLDDLTAALERVALAVERLPMHSEAWVSGQMNWANKLIDRYRALLDEDDRRAAFDHLKQAEQGAQRLGAHANKAQERAEGSRLRANVLINGAITLTHSYEASGDIAELDQALERLDRAELLVPKGSQDWAWCRQNRANALIHRALYSTRLADLEIAAETCREALQYLQPGSRDWTAASVALAHVAALRYDLTERTEFLSEAIDRYRELVNSFPVDAIVAAPLQAALANALLRRHQAQHDIVDLSAAIGYLSNARALFPEGSLDAARATANLASALLIRGTIYDETDDSILAQLDQAAQIFPSGSLGQARCHATAGHLLRLHARLTGDRQQLLESLRRYEEAAVLLRERRQFIDLQRVLLALGRGRQQVGEHAAAWAAMVEAIATLEDRLLGLPAQRDQLWLLQQDGDAYQQIVSLCLAVASAATGEGRALWQQRAWEYAERSRAWLTAQEVLASGRLGTTPQDEEFRLTFERWKRLVAQLQASASADGSQTMVSPIPARVRALEDELFQLRQKLGQLLPGLDVLQPLAPPSLANVRAALPAHGLLVELFALPDELVIFIVDGHALHIRRAAIGEDALNALTQTFYPYRIYQDRDELAQLQATLDEALRRLARALMPVLEPALAELRAVAEAEPGRAPHLLFVPTRELHLWPLHMLPYGEQGRLLDHFAVAYLPAGNLLPGLAGQSALPGDYHGFAPPTEKGRGYLKRSTAHISGEAALLRAVVADKAHVYAHEAARLSTLAGIEGGIASVFTHGWADPTNPERATLQFAGEDGRIDQVTALEIMTRLGQPGCQALLLWGCLTHGAGAQAGDNWLGLTRAFLRAGRTLVASLWPILEDLTFAIGIRCCLGLREGLSVPEALRIAVLSVGTATRRDLWEWGRIVYDLAEGDAQEEFAVHWEETFLRNYLLDSDLTKQGMPLDWQFECWCESRRYGLAVLAPYVSIGWPGALTA